MRIHRLADKPLWVLLFLLLGTGLLYANAIDNDFTLDDHAKIENNSYLRTLGGVGYLFFHPLEEGQASRGHLYRPFPALVQHLAGTLHGFTPRTFHLLNVLFYALGACFLFLLLKALFDAATALAAAAIFACHPIHTEVVASAVGVAELLAFLFAMASLLAARRALEKPRWGVAAGLCCLVALLSKETAVLLPALACLLAYHLRTDRRRLLLLGAAYTAPLAVYFALRHHVIGSFLSSSRVEFAFLDNPLCALPAVERMVNAVYILLRYLLLLIAPVRLSADYSYEAIPLLSSPWTFGFLASIAAFGALLLLAWRARRDRFLVTFAVAILLLGLLPGSNLLFCGGTIMGERLAFLASAGLALALSGAWRAAGARSPAVGKLATAGLTVLLAGFCYLTVIRNRDWADDHTLFEKVRQTHPGNAKAHYNVAILDYRNGDLDESRRKVERALEIYDGYTDARILLAELSLQAGDPARAERVLLEAQEIDGRHEDVFVQLGTLYARTGRLRQAIDVYRQGTQALPQSIKLPHNLALIYMELGEHDRAEPYLRRVIDGGALPDAHFALANVLLTRGDYHGALAELRSAEASARYGAQAIKLGAFCHVMLGRYAAAEAELERLSRGGIDADTRVLIAYSRLKNGDLSGARDELRSARLGSERDCARLAFPVLCGELMAMGER